LNSLEKLHFYQKVSMFQDSSQNENGNDEVLTQDESIYSSVIECPHEYITNNGVCAGCGVNYAGWNQKGKVYYSKPTLCPQNKSGDRNILNDLAKYNLPDEIRHEANEIFRKINMPTRRGKERTKMLFFLVYTAYREKGLAVYPTALAKDMGLKPGDVSRALTSYSEAQTNYHPNIGKVSAIEALVCLCSSLEIIDIIDDVKEMANEILTKCPSLNEEFPHKVSAGILTYFMEINGIKIPQETFRKHVDFSDVTIKEIHQRIGKIYNQ
jgi:hypothetical protein